ncbi:ATP-binding protein [Streptomyces sp. NPDC006335]|uniref:ATP-binding protein n=1 Tax=Streptomyces sp. NPDC006335 TaxID=3156895 RepID=UPI0033BBD403
MPVTGLHAAPTEIRLQQGDTGFPLDDVVAVDRSGPFEFVVEKQVKRTLKVAPGEEAWRKTIRQCLASLERFGTQLDQRQRWLGIVATGPMSALQDLQRLAEAADKPHLEDFLADLGIPGRRGEPYQKMWRHLTATVGQLLTEPHGPAPEQRHIDETAFRLARRLVVQIEPEREGPSYQALLGLLDTVVDSARGPGPAAVFRMLVEIAREFGPQAGVIDVAMLRDLLHVRHAVLRGDPPARPELEAVDRWTQRFLDGGRVAHRVGGRLHLERQHLSQALRKAVGTHERVLLTGPAGAGKSALARSFARTVQAAGGTVFALSLTERTWRSAADVGQEVGARLERTFAAAAGGERLLLVDGCEQVLTDGGALLASLLDVLPRADGGRWRVVAVAREQAADRVEKVLGGAEQGDVHRLQTPGLDEDEVRAVLAAFPALARLSRSRRSARLLRNLFVVEQLVRATVDGHGPRQVLGEEDVAAWVYGGLVRGEDVHQPGRGGPDERTDAYLAMADIVIGGRAWASLRGVPGAAREGLVSDGILVRDRAEFTFAHDVHQDYAIAVRLDMSDAPDLADVPNPRRLLRGFRLWAQMLLARTAERAPGRLAAVWQDITARAQAVAGVDDVRWTDVPYEALFELGSGTAVLEALTAELLDDGGLMLAAAVSRRLPDPEAAVPVLAFLLAHHADLAPLAADTALVCTATWLLALGERVPKDLLARVPQAVAGWYDGERRRAQEAACALAAAAGHLDDAGCALLAGIAFRHPLSVQCVLEDRRLSRPLARCAPTLLARLAKAFYLGHPYARGHVDPREGVRELGWPFVDKVTRDLRGGPDPAGLGPFGLLLEHAPEHGLALIGAVADAATTAVTRRGDEHAERQLVVTWPLADGPRTYTGTSRVCEWPTAGQPGPAPAIAALAALHRWADARAKQGAPLAEVVEQVMGCGTSIALVAVIVDVLCGQATRVETELDPALEQLQVWLMPTSSRLHTAIQSIVVRAGRERQDAYRLLGRRITAEHASMRDPWPTAPGTKERRRTRDQIVETIAKLLDFNEYVPVDLEGTRYLTLVLVPNVLATREEGSADLYRFAEQYVLRDDACRARDTGSAVDVQRLIERMAVLETSLEASPTSEDIGALKDIRAAVAAVILQSAGRQVAVEPWQLDWAAGQIMAAAAATPAALTETDLVCEEHNDQAGDRSAAVIVPVLLGDEDLRRRTGLSAQEAIDAVAWLAGSGFVEVRAALAASLANQWAHSPCPGPSDLLHGEGLAALTTMVATAGLHPADEQGTRHRYQLTDPAQTLSTSTTALLDLRLAAPAIAALHHAARTDCGHQAQAAALSEALWAHDRRTWTSQDASMAAHSRSWRQAHDEITAAQALAGDRRRLEQSVEACAGAPNAIVGLLLALARQAVTPAHVTELLALWPGLLEHFLSPERPLTWHLREALLPFPADGVDWPPLPTEHVIKTWATAHAGHATCADHLIRVLDRHRLDSPAAMNVVLDVLGTDAAAITCSSRSAVAFLHHVLSTPPVRTSATGQRAHRLLDALAATGDADALRAQHTLEEAPTLD